MITHEVILPRKTLPCTSKEFLLWYSNIICKQGKKQMDVKKKETLKYAMNWIKCSHAPATP